MKLKLLSGLALLGITGLTFAATEPLDEKCAGISGKFFGTYMSVTQYGGKPDNSDKLYVAGAKAEKVLPDSAVSLILLRCMRGLPLDGDLGATDVARACKAKGQTPQECSAELTAETRRLMKSSR